MPPIRWFLIVIAALVLAGCSAGTGGLFSRGLATTPGVVDGNTAAAIISEYRASRGLGPVRVNGRLTRLAEEQAERMAAADTLAHELPGQVNFKQRVAAGGYQASLVAENAGAGYDSLETAISRWRASPSHDQNLLLPEISEIGIGMAHVPDSRFGNYWALVLAAPRGSAGG